MRIQELMTREQAVAEVGEELVDAVERQNCDFTGRLMGNGEVEFSASVVSGDATIVAYYYQDADAVEGVDDLGDLEWEVAGYEVV